jgi:aspartyl-tRNA synthetase
VSHELEGLGDWRRTHTCGELRREHAGNTVTLMGWLHRSRDHGGVLFTDLRDRYGLTQVVFHPETGGKTLLDRASRIGNEFVIAVRGIVTERPADAVNADLATGTIEVDAREMKLLSACDPLPFQVNEEHMLASEDLRLKFRYLDLRRPELAAMLALRHQAAMAARAYLSGQSFLEIETPMLVKPTPEGARDYVVPSRVHHGSFYALPQSPQLYKQTLMISGCDRYFQLARCLRDEDLRADRQPEHTQIDLEMSFVTEDDVFAAVEGLFASIWKETLGVTIPTPFPRITYDESMRTYGSDKPDLRFGLTFTDVTAICAQSPRNVVANGAKAPGGVAVAMMLPGGAEISGTQLRKFEDVVKAAGAGGLTFFKVLASDREKQQVIFPGALLDEFLAKVGAKDGDAVVFTNGPWERTCKALGVLRSQLGRPSSRSGPARENRERAGVAVRLGAAVPALRVERRPLGAETPHVHDAEPRASRVPRDRPRQGVRAALRRRAERQRARLGIDPHPPPRHPGARDEGDRAHARTGAREVRVPARGLSLCVATARRDRHRPRPHHHAARRPRLDP